MCWYGKLLSKQVAKDDIHCKKIIAYNSKDKFYFPYYIRYGEIKRYEIGKTYTSNLEIINVRTSVPNNCYIKDGLHCYSWDVTVLANKNKFCDSVLAVIDKKGGRDYYWFEKPQPGYPILVDCIIPKGATYYKNDRGEIVTDTLKLVKIIEPTKVPFKI